MAGQRVPIRGFRYKDGKLVKASRAKSVSARIKERRSKRIRSARRGSGGGA